MTSRARPVPALLLAVSVLAACGVSGGTGTDVPQREVPGEPDTGTELVVTLTDGTGTPPRTWTLTCNPPGGDHPDPDAACRALDAAQAPFAPVPPGLACTQIYGGPETATIAGTWRGAAVQASYKRTDGCEIARWAAVAPVLGS